MNHLGALPLRVLADWLEGRLAPEQAEAVAATVAAGDARTLAGVEWLRRFLDASGRFPLDQPPPLVRDRLNRQFQLRYGGVQGIQGPLVPLHGRKVYDSRRDLTLAGVRGTGSGSQVIHLAFRAGSADLLLDAFRLGDGRLRLDGQLLYPGKDLVVEAAVRGPGIRLRTVDGDTLGRFSVDGVPEAATELEVDAGEVAMIVPLDLGRPGAE